MNTIMLFAALLKSIEACILILTGASSMEELSEEQLDRFEYWQQHPVRINSSSRARLAASGLLSAYQAASIVDYRERCGDIVSLPELAAVDGIGGRYAEALAPFVSLESSRRLCERPRDSLRVRTEATLRGQVRERDNVAQGAYAGKLRLTAEGLVEAALSLCSKVSVSDPLWPPAEPSFSACLSTDKARIVIGDFNVRLGQGIALWSGFSLSGYPTLNSFCRNASGIGPSFSYEPYHRGIAADYRIRNCTISSALSLPALGKSNTEPLIAANWLWRRAQLGLNSSAVILPDGSLSSARLGADFRLSRGSFDIFSEINSTVFPKTALEAIAGAFFNAGYRHRYGIVCRYLPKDLGAAIGAHYKDLDIVFDYSANPVARKETVKYSFNWSSDASKPVQFVLRWQERYKPQDKVPLRSELRTDIKSVFESFHVNVRADGLYYNSFGWLSYLEGGYERKGLKAYVRGTVYETSCWADRIYCYERDVPGYFSVPALYGKGWKASAILTCRMDLRRYRRLQMSMRADTSPEARFSLAMLF